MNSLVDLGLLKESSCGTKIAMLVTYILTGLAWLVTIRVNSTEGFMLLYVGVIAISCGIYTVAEFVSLVVRKGTGFSKKNHFIHSHLILSNLSVVVVGLGLDVRCWIE